MTPAVERLKKANAALLRKLDDLSSRVVNMEHEARVADSKIGALRIGLEKSEKERTLLEQRNAHLLAGLDELHTLLDSLPSAPPRTIEAQLGEDEEVKLSAVTRLCLFVLSRTR